MNSLFDPNEIKAFKKEYKKEKIHTNETNNSDIDVIYSFAIILIMAIPLYFIIKNLFIPAIKEFTVNVKTFFSKEVFFNKKKFKKYLYFSGLYAFFFIFMMLDKYNFLIYDVTPHRMSKFIETISWFVIAPLFLFWFTFWIINKEE